MNPVSRIGENAIRRFRVQSRLASVVWGVLSLAFRRTTWRRPVVNVLSRQILFTAIGAIPFITLLAVMVGISIVVQAVVWLGRVGQSGFLGPVLVMVIVREVGPLLVNFVVIGRSGTAMATELGNMSIAGEVRVLDAQGLDPFVYLVTPRVLGAAISVFCLTVIFIAASFLSGYVSGVLMGVNTGDPALFTAGVFRAIKPADVLNVLAKTLIPGMVTGAICCIEGLGVSTAVTEVPQAATRTVVRSTAALFVISAVVSVLTYM